MGLERVCELKAVEQMMKEYWDKKTLVISAFDNFGGVSFPAACKYTLGVIALIQMELSLIYRMVELV